MYSYRLNPDFGAIKLLKKLIDLETIAVTMIEFAMATDNVDTEIIAREFLILTIARIAELDLNPRAA